MEDSPFLSVIIPIWNEKARLPSTLQTVVDYLEKQEYTTEVIVVDDGSTDGSQEAVEAFIADHEGMPTVQLIENDHRGKGYAVRTGMLRGEGKYILFTDADLSTPIYEVGKVIGALEAGSDIAIGTRQGIGVERLNEPLFHHLLRRAFNLLVRLMAGLPYHDTQAGFKGFRREVARDLFQRVQLYGADAELVRGSVVTAFDVEVLLLATQAGYRIEEVPVKWTYSREGKSSLLAQSARMLTDVIKVRWMMAKGRYET